jgi:hypothetical protein
VTRTALCVLVLGMVIAGCGGSSSDEPIARAAPLSDLTEIGQLRAAFNERPGVPRLILLLSPT